MWNSCVWIWCPDLKVPWTRRTMWETHHGSQASQNPTSLFFLEVERAAVQKNFQGFCDLLWIEGRSLDWLVGGTRVYSPANVEADVCWQFCSRGKKIWEKNSLGLPGLGFILHLSFPHLPLEGAQLPAVQVLQVGVFSHPDPRRQLGPATDLGGFWVQPGIQGSLKRSPSNSLGRVGTVRALHFRTGISENPVRVFHFRSSLFQKGTAGMTYDRSHGFGDCISWTPIARPL